MSPPHYSLNNTDLSIESHWTVNGQEVSQEDFAALRQQWELMVPEQAASFEDGKFQSQEIRRLFDSNDNGLITLSELRNFRRQWGARQFNLVRNMLREHGWDPYRHAGLVHPTQDGPDLFAWVEFSREDEFLLQALERQPNLFHRVGRERLNELLESHSETLLEPFLQNYRRFSEVSMPIRQVLWNATVARAREAYPSLPQEFTASYSVFRAWVKRQTDFPDRFHSFASVAMLHQSSQGLFDPEDARPVALLAYNTTDYNRAFEMPAVIEAFSQDDRFRTVYVEVSNETDLNRVLAEASEGGEHPLHTLVLAGHGTPTSLQLGEGDAKCDEGSFVDLYDFVQGDFAELHRYVRGQVLLYSCSNGAGGKAYKNLANFTGENLNRDTRVYATQVPSNIQRLKIREDLSLSIQWWAPWDYERNGSLPT
jgi:hypothetical protein